MPARVSIEKTATGFTVLRDGQPYFVKGAVGRVRLDQLAAAGVNSTRTGPRRLDEAQRYGLTALTGLPVGLQRRWFEYRDQGAVDQQRSRVREIVQQWREHPALLIWNLGNEPEIRTTEEQRRELWAEVNRLAEIVHETDPNHPVITVVSDASTAEFRLPVQEGNYRLFVYVRDGHGNAATRNGASR
jgi:beta-galactosidase/beta-glucuronidase